MYQRRAASAHGPAPPKSRRFSIDKGDGGDDDALKSFKTNRIILASGVTPSSPIV